MKQPDRGEMQNYIFTWLKAGVSAATRALWFLSLLSVSHLLWAADGRAEDAPVSSYSNYLTQVDDRVVLAGSLDLDALRTAHEGSIEIIDLRTEPEGAPEEAAQAEALGFGYTNIPVSSATVSPTQVDTLLAALSAADSEAMIVVHCASGNRAGMLWGAAQLAEGVPLETVRTQVDGIMTKQPVIDGLEAYAKTLDAH